MFFAHRNAPKRREPSPMPSALPARQYSPDLGGPSEAVLDHLEAALAQLEAFTRDRLVAAAIVINPLLVVWEAASGISPATAARIEALLTAAVQREMLQCQRIRDCTYEVRAIALQESVLSALTSS